MLEGWNLNGQQEQFVTFVVSLSESADVSKTHSHLPASLIFYLFYLIMYFSEKSHCIANIYSLYAGISEESLSFSNIKNSVKQVMYKRNT